MTEIKAPKISYMSFPAVDRTLMKHRLLTPQEFDRAINIVASSYGITPKELTSRSRRAKFVRPRHMLSLLLRNIFYKVCFTDIGYYLERNHATILVACKKIKGEIELYKDVKEEYKHLEMLI